MLFDDALTLVHYSNKIGENGVSEIPKVIDGLRVARNLADKETDGDLLHYLIDQALQAAIAEAQRRNLPIPPEAPPTEH